MSQRQKETRLQVEFKIKDLPSATLGEYYVTDLEGYESVSGQQDLLGQSEHYFNDVAPLSHGKIHDVIGVSPSLFRVKVVTGHLLWEATRAIHKIATLTFHTLDRHGNTVSKRYFTGHIMQSGHIGEIRTERFGGQVGQCYEFEICPWIWYLAYTRKSRSFKHKTVEEIFSAVVEEYGYNQGNQYEFRSKSQYPRDYVVEFEESDFCFLFRLLESEGKYFYHIYDDLSYKLVVCDGNEDFAHNDDHFSVIDTERAETLPGPYVYSSRVQVNTVPGSFAAQERNYTNTVGDGIVRQKLHKASDLHPERKIDDPHESVRSVFRFNQRLFKSQRGSEEVLDDRLSAISVPERVVYGRGRDIRMAAGHVWKFRGSGQLTRYFGQSARFNLLRVEHRWDGTAYDNYFIATDHSVKYQTYPHTPIPKAYSLHAARVVCRDGLHKDGGIDVDAHGRVFLKFWWEPGNEVSIAARVRSDRAGPGGFGDRYTPRVGTEVLVCFVQGNLEEPVVVGSVHNGANMHYLDPAQYPNHSHSSTPGCTTVHYEPESRWATGASPNADAGKSTAAHAGAVTAPMKAVFGGKGAPANGSVSPFKIDIENPDLKKAISFLRKFGPEGSADRVEKSLSGSFMEEGSKSATPSSQKRKSRKEKARRKRGGGVFFTQWWDEISADEVSTWKTYHGNYQWVILGNQLSLAAGNTVNIYAGLKENINVGASFSFNLAANFTINAGLDYTITLYNKWQFLLSKHMAVRSNKIAASYTREILDEKTTAANRQVVALEVKKEEAQRKSVSLSEELTSLQQDLFIANSVEKRGVIRQKIAEKRTEIAQENTKVLAFDADIMTKRENIETYTAEMTSEVVSSEKAVHTNENYVRNAEAIMLG